MRAALARKGAAAVFDELLEVDGRWRETTTRVDALRHATKAKGRPTDEERVRLASIGRELEAESTTLAAIEAERSELLSRVPNPPDPSVPDGIDDDDAVVVKVVGDLPHFDFEPLEHLALGGFDTERGARLSGSRFAYRMGPTALVELSLYRYALDHLVAKGFVPVLPPVLVREEAMYGTGFLPTEESNLYRVEPDGLYLTGTSEVALAGLHQREVLDAEELPLRYAGYSTCFRREAGAAGKDTRGVFRVHQFDKVEMYVYCAPEDSRAEHEAILAIEEELVQGLGLPYRVVCTAAGDLGPSAAKKYDIEAWIPSQGRYREITSCSNTTDYQARRLGTRWRRAEGIVHPHTLNGTAMTARWLIALLENHQDAHGGVRVPEALHPFGAPRELIAEGR